MLKSNHKKYDEYKKKLKSLCNFLDLTLYYIKKELQAFRPRKNFIIAIR